MKGYNIMKRRNFLTLGLVAVASSLPSTLSAIDYRATKPKTWTAHEQKDAIKELYGDIKPLSEGVKLKTPKVANNGGAIPIIVRSDIDAKSVAIFQDVNPESTVAVYTIPEGGMIDFLVKIKMKRSGNVTVIIEGRDGKFYMAKNELEVALGGCEG
jgi:sulfur-oxidizing protein SoxY